MVRTFLRAGAALALSLSLAGAPASADPTGPYGAAVNGANAAIKSAMTVHLPDGTVAQVPPVNQPSVGGKQSAAIGLPTGFTYTLDASIARSTGMTGNFGRKWLPGGVDAVIGYGFNPTTRFVANYYELQHYPIHFDSGQVPLYLPAGFPPTPGVNPSCVDLTGANSATCQGISPQIDVTTKDKFALFMFEKLFLIKAGSRSLPVVITPTYVSRWSQVAASNGAGDIVPFVDANGTPHFNVNTRTAQVYSLAVTLPFLKTPKMFGTFTVAPSWLVHRAGLNIENKPQLYQILYIEYVPAPGFKIFAEPQSSRDYLPADPYAQHLAAIFLGVSHSVGKSGFLQLIVNSGTPTNYTPYGVYRLNCLQLPCSANTVPSVGGLKASQIQLQFGIGSPSVIQF